MLLFFIANLQKERGGNVCLSKTAPLNGNSTPHLFVMSTVHLFNPYA